MSTPPPGPPPPPAPPYLDPYYQPPPPPGPPPRAQLRRSRTDKVIGGVSGGLAQYSGIDPLLWRVGFVALAFAGGTGILVYLLLWLLMPAGPSAPDSVTEATAGPAEPTGPRSPVPGVTVAGLLIVVGLIALISRYTSWNPDARVYIGAALLAVGLGLLAAAFSGGRAAKGGLITLGIVLSMALLFASAEPWRGVRGGVGDRTYAPTIAENVRPVYRAGIGDVRLDLSAIDVSNLDAPIRTRLDHGVGDLHVVVPGDADVRVSVDGGLGNIDVFNREAADGGLFPGEGAGAWIGDGEAEIELTIDAGIGDVEVSRG